MSYEKQLASEALKRRMYELALEKPYTRNDFVKVLKVKKTIIVNHIVRLSAKGHLKLSPLKKLEAGPQRTVPVSQYVSNPKKPYEPKQEKDLSIATVKRFSLGRKKIAPKSENPNVHVYNLLDNPIPRAPKKNKRVDINIGSSFNLMGW